MIHIFEDRPQPKKKRIIHVNWKWISLGLVGSLFTVSQLGIIGYIATRKTEPTLPSINPPVGAYTSYKVSVQDDGYVISYKANDPKTAYITKDIKKKGGFLGLANNTTKIAEEYFMDGQTNQGGAVSNNRSWLDGKPGLTQGQSAEITAHEKVRPVLKQSEVQKAQEDLWVLQLVQLLLLLLVLFPLLVGSWLAGWLCLVVIKEANIGGNMAEDLNKNC